MKKILIVASSLVTGGLEKCLIDLCNAIDYEKYSVDLYLFNDGRDLLPQLNQNVHLLPDSPLYSTVYNMPLFKSLVSLLKRFQLRLFFYRIGRFVRARLGKTRFTETDWRMMQKTMLRIDTQYDAAMGYEECTACYYVAHCVQAKVKSGWIHTDIQAIDTNGDLDRKAFEKLDHICTVSQNSLNSLMTLYPQFENKYQLFFTPALFDYEKIDRMAKEDAGFDRAYRNIVSLGRLVELKGFHLCVPVLKRLIDEGYPVKWYVAGEGSYRAELEGLIAQYNVQDAFILLGNQENPYKYISAADICVQPSSYEGLSLVVIEEKYLQKAVVATSIYSNLQILSHQENGLLVERNENAIYSAVKCLLDDEALRNRIGAAPINGYVDKNTAMKKLEVILNENQTGTCEN